MLLDAPHQFASPIDQRLLLCPNVSTRMGRAGLGPVAAPLLARPLLVLLPLAAGARARPGLRRRHVHRPDGCNKCERGE